MPARSAHAVVLAPGEGETMFDIRERTIRVLADRPELAVTWFRLEPGQHGPEPHVHRRHTDAFYVLEGELELGLGPDVRPTPGPAGTLAAAPPEVVHTFRNTSDSTVVFLNVHAPNVGFADMLRAARDGRNEDEERFDQFEPPADGGRPLSDAVFRGPGDGEATGNGVSKTAGSEVEGFFALVELTLAPGASVPIGDPERAFGLYVLDGDASLELDGDHVDAGRGAFALVPPGSPGLVANRSQGAVRIATLAAAGPETRSATLGR